MKRANILGLGPSLQSFIDARPEGITVGVNDIFRRVEVEHVVCVDKPHTFDTTRREVIKTCTPEKFYSQIEEWKRHHGERFVPLNVTARFDAKLFSKWESLPRGLDSTFIAAMVAYHLGARLIVVYGADFVGHPVLGRQDRLEKIRKCYHELLVAMGLKGCLLRLGGGEGALKGILPAVTSGEIAR